MRVALRRLRSALTMFRKVITLPELEDIRARARRIASAWARRANAMPSGKTPSLDRSATSPSGLKAAALLLEAVENRRGRELCRRPRGIIDSPEATLFVLDVQAFLIAAGLAQRHSPPATWISSPPRRGTSPRRCWTG